jgi:hypothetical protein
MAQPGDLSGPCREILRAPGTTRIQQKVSDCVRNSLQKRETTLGNTEERLPSHLMGMRKGGNMKRFTFFGVVLAIGVLTAPVSAGTIGASGVLTSTANGSDFNYTITLTNTSGTGNDSIETFWFGWTPGQDYMAGAMPFNITTPSGWTDIVTGSGNSTDGYAIQFKTSTAALAPGDSLTFEFTSAETPAELAGNSLFHAHPPVTTSFVYSGQPFDGDSAQFVVSSVSSVPEPSSLSLGLLGVIASVAYFRFKRKRMA